MIKATGGIGLRYEANALCKLGEIPMVWFGRGPPKLGADFLLTRLM